ncbi:MAG: glycosyltransferase [Chloroflexi bacterium]|nr:glycosyltransferase [Chloroflexota bacterium]
MTRRDKAVFAVLLVTYAASAVYYAVWWFQPEHIPQNWSSLGFLGALLDTVYFALLSFVIWRGVVQNLFTFWIVSSMKTPVYVSPSPGSKVAMLTAFVPGKEPYETLVENLAAMKRVSYPHDTWVLDEGDDPVVKNICRRLGVKHFSRKNVPEYNQPAGKFKAKTKGGNHNAWGAEHGDEYDFVAQMDVDFIPKPDFLEKTLGYFQDPSVAFVGSPQIYGNQDASWITRGAAEQAFIFYGPMQKGLYGKGMQLLIGANHVLRTAAWRDVDGYAGHIVEDHLTGMKIYARGWKSVYVPEVLCVGEGPPSMAAYLTQQTRWAFGCLDILFRHTPRFMSSWKWTHRLGYPLLQVWYVFGLAQLLGVVLTTLYLTVGLRVTSMSFLEWLWHASPAFFVGLLAFQWLQKFNIDPRTENGFYLKGFLLNFAAWPVYALAFFYVVIGHKIAYAVTPKGSANASQLNRVSLRRHIPHLVSATISLVGLLAMPFSRFQAPQLVFWAVVNFVAMSVTLGADLLPALSLPAVVRMRPVLSRLAAATATIVCVGLVLYSAADALVFPDEPGSAHLDPSRTWTAIRRLATPSSAASPPEGIVQPDGKESVPVSAHFLDPKFREVAIGVYPPDDALRPVAKIAHSFATWSPDGAGRMGALAQDAAKNGQVSMISWEPRLSSAPSAGEADASLLRRIGEGEFDGHIADVAARLKMTGQPILLRFGHEMDLPDDGLHPWSYQPAQTYVEAYRRIHRVFEEQQADNVFWVWSPGGRFEDGEFTSTKWYPGDSYVDFVGLSVFVYWEWEEWDEARRAAHSYRSPREAIQPAYEEVLKLGKPIILAEVGVDLHRDREKERATWILAMLDRLRNKDFSRIVAVVFYDTRHPLRNYDADWRLNDEERRAVADAVSADELFELPFERWRNP